MTTSQERKVDYLRREAEKMASEYHNNGEIKKFEVVDHGSFVSVYIEVGDTKDEGTLAAFICREKAHIFIGKRGAMEFPVWDAKRCDQRYKKFRSLWCAYYDQENNVVKGSYK